MYKLFTVNQTVLPISEDLLPRNKKTKPTLLLLVTEKETFEERASHQTKELPTTTAAANKVNPYVAAPSRVGHATRTASCEISLLDLFPAA